MFAIGGYEIGLHGVSLLACAAASLGVGVRGTLAESETSEDAYLLVLTAILSLFLASQAMMAGAPDRPTALRWSETCLFLIPFCTGVAHRFGLEMAGPDRSGKILNALFLAAASVMGLSVIGNRAFLGGVREAPWGWHFELGNGAAILGVYVTATLLAAGWQIARAYLERPEGPVRRRSRWFFAAFGLAALGILLDAGAAFGWSIYPGGYVCFLVAGLTALYSIDRHDFTLLTPAFAAEQIFETLADPVLVVDNDRRIRVLNDRSKELFGYDDDDLVGEPIETLAPDDPEHFRECLCSGNARDDEIAFATAEGDSLIMSVSSAELHTDEGERAGAVIIARDIRDRKEAERALERSRERYALAARGAHDGLWDWNLAEDHLYLSDRWKQMLGYEPSDFEDDPSAWFGHIHPEDRDRVEDQLDAHLDGETDHFESEHRIRHADGDYRWVMCRGVAIRDDAGDATRIAGSQTDITERKRAEEQLRHDAFHDALTDLPNRALFIDRLERALDLQQRHSGRPFSLLFLDLDRFKMVNDSLGHSVGDKLLKAVADCLRETLREADTVARIGGDEFAVLLPEVSSRERARAVADRIRRALEEPFRIDDHELFASASVGVLVSDSDYDDPEDLLRDADLAMYRAKRDRARDIAAFDAEMGTAVPDESHLESDLQRALDRDELVLEYQPLLTIDDESLAGLEALVRWSHPDHGRVSPGEFVPLAEETGLIEPMGSWIRREACRRASDWYESGRVDRTFKLSVNLSPRELANDRILDDFSELLGEVAIPPDMLLVEITEEMLITSADRAADVFDALADLGIRVCIDDFGTGYSSLSYLQQFTAHYLKMDREFVAGLEKGGQDREIVHSIMELAEKLDLTVIAEGVETERQLETLREIGIPIGQGFLWSRALPARELFEDSLLERTPTRSETPARDPE